MELPIYNGKYMSLPTIDSHRDTEIVIAFSNDDRDTRNDDDDDNNDKYTNDSHINDKFIKPSKRFCNRVSLILRYVSVTRRNIYYCCYILYRICKLLTIPSFILITLYLGINYDNISSRQHPLSDWSTKKSRNISEYVLPDQMNTTIVEPRNICQDKMFLLIIICSRVENFVMRQVIRETWGNLTEFNYGTFAQLHANYKGPYAPVMEQRIELYKAFLQLNNSKSSTLPYKLPVRALFLLGNRNKNEFIGNETTMRLHQEAEQYNDIIQENFIDTYTNLTIKSVMALKWLIKSACNEQVAFFMKCDDDTFVNIPNLLHFLLGGTIPLYNDTLEYYDRHSLQKHLKHSDRLNDTVDYLVGHQFCSVRPVANVSSKWYMPYDMYPNDTYPTYLSGAGYLMSSNVITKLYTIALNTTIVYLEDVYVTGICAKRASITRHHHPLFNYNTSNRLCSFKGIITSHGLQDSSMYNAYNFVANFSNRCALPSKYFKYSSLKKKDNC